MAIKKVKKEKILYLKRVPYGKPSTSKELREYKIVGIASPVGTLKDWSKFAKRHKFTKIEVVDFEKMFMISEKQIKKFKKVS